MAGVVQPAGDDQRLTDRCVGAARDPGRQPLRKRAGHPLLASAIHAAADSAFFQGFHAANYLAAGIAAAGGVMALVLLPAQPATSHEDTPEVPAARTPATAAAHS